jgi:hypothetical protein
MGIYVMDLYVSISTSHERYVLIFIIQFPFALNSGSVCYHSIQNILSFSFFSENLHIKECKIITLPLVLNRCETWSFTLSEEHRLRAFENKELRKMSGPKKDEVTADLRKLLNGEFQVRGNTKCWFRNIKGRDHLGNLGLRGEDNTKMALTEDIKCNEMTQERVQ